MTDDISELFEEYLTKNRFYHFEGERGVRDLETLVRDIGGSPTTRTPS